MCVRGEEEGSEVLFDRDGLLSGVGDYAAVSAPELSGNGT